MHLQELDLVLFTIAQHAASTHLSASCADDTHCRPTMAVSDASAAVLRGDIE